LKSEKARSTLKSLGGMKIKEMKDYIIEDKPK
jgi:hypothetical protein